MLLSTRRRQAMQSRARWRLLSTTAFAGLLVSSSLAGAQTWNGSDSQYNSAANWTPNDVPDSAGEAAIFGASSLTAINVSGIASPQSWTFALNAPGYTISGGTVSFDLSGGLFNNSASTQTINTVIAGAGRVVQSGNGGSLWLSGANTYTGGTEVTNGYLRVANSQALGTGAVTLTGGTFTFSTPGLTLSNAFVLNGLAGIQGSGTLTGGLSGSGELRVTSGNLVLGPGSASTNTGRIVVNSGARLTADARTGSGSPGAIGNQASVVMNNGGILDIASGETIGSLEGTSGTVNMSGDFRVGENNRSTAYGGQITGGVAGAFGLRKVGTGTLTLTGNNPATGYTAIYDGAIELNGQLGGTINVNGSGGGVNTRGTLAGTGTATGTVNIDTNLAPGTNSGANIGILNINRAVFGSASIYYVTINDAGQSDRLNVTGNAATTLGGSVTVDPLAGTYTPGTQYTILQTTAGASFGSTRFHSTVQTIGGELAFLTPVLSYDSTNTEVYLTLDPKIADSGSGRLGFNTVAFTPNQIAVATAADQLPLGHRVFNTLAVQTAENARRAFDALSGEVNVSATSAASADMALVQNAVLDRLRAAPYGAPQALAAVSSAAVAYAADLPARKGLPVAAPPAPGPAYSLWGQALGARGTFEGDWNAASLTRNTGGLIVGVDTGFDGRWRAGFAGAWTRSSLDVASRFSSGDLDTFSGSLYGSAQFGALALRGGLSYAHHEVDTSRTILFPGYTGAVGTSFGGRSLLAFSEVGYGLQFASLALEPFAGLAHVSTDLGGFAEAGDAAALVGHDGRTDVTYSSLGVRVAVPLGALTARGGVSWRHAFGDVTPTGTLAFAANPAVPFTVSGTPLARDTLALEAGLDWAVSRHVALGLKYDGQFASNVREHGVKADLRVSF